MSSKILIDDILKLANPEKAKISQRFFKTGKGEYGEGDVFIGLTMPQIREVVRKYCLLDKGEERANLTPSNGEWKNKLRERKTRIKLGDFILGDINELLNSKYHEIRMAGVLILVEFAKKKVYPLEEIAEIYLRNAHFFTPKVGKNVGINNWDLVDVSSEHIIGPYIEQCLTHEERVKFINTCIEHPNIWINRIIILASFYQIKKRNGKLTIYIAERMLDHQHDLMHKAVGWMLREMGKRCSIDELRGFLDQYAAKMPRTMLRYAIEKMEQEEREYFLKKKYSSFAVEQNKI